MKSGQLLSDLNFRKKAVRKIRQVVSKDKPDCLVAVNPSDIVLATMVAYEMGIPLYYRWDDSTLNTETGLYGVKCLMMADHPNGITQYKSIISQIKSSGADVLKLVYLVEPESVFLKGLEKIGVPCSRIAIK